MADPVIVGAISAGAGAIVGYLGTLTTAVLTRGREDRARVFETKRVAYADCLTSLFAAFRSSLYTRDKLLDAEPDSVLELKHEYFEAFANATNAVTVVRMLAPRHVYEQASKTLSTIQQPFEEESAQLQSDYTHYATKLADLVRKDLGVADDESETG